MSTKSILSVLAVVILIVGALVVVWMMESRRPVEREVARITRQDDFVIPRKETREMRVPAFQSEAAIPSLRPTLNPQAFTGAARAAYQVAQEIPDTLAQIPCYCHCDMSIGRKSLHSCFVDDHGANCGVCQNEAITAYNLRKEKKLSAAEIRQRIIADYGK